jgi:hypothetical protein
MLGWILLLFISEGDPHQESQRDKGEGGGGRERRRRRRQRQSPPQDKTRVDIARTRRLSTSVRYPSLFPSSLLLTGFPRPRAGFLPGRTLWLDRGPWTVDCALLCVVCCVLYVVYGVYVVYVVWCVYVCVCVCVLCVPGLHCTALHRTPLHCIATQIGRCWCVGRCLHRQSIWGRLIASAGANSLNPSTFTTRDGATSHQPLSHTTKNPGILSISLLFAHTVTHFHTFYSLTLFTFSPTTTKNYYYYYYYYYLLLDTLSLSPCGY